MLRVRGSGKPDDYKDCYAQKIGLKGLKEATDSESYGLKDGCVSTSEDLTSDSDVDIILKYSLPKDPGKSAN